MLLCFLFVRRGNISYGRFHYSPRSKMYIIALCREEGKCGLVININALDNFIIWVGVRLHR
jgi:hypothetical protein